MAPTHPLPNVQLSYGPMLIVLFLFCIETANTVLDMVLMYQPLILEYGQKPLFFPTVFMTPIVSLLAVASFAGGLWTAIRIVTLKFIADKILKHDSELLWLVAACAADIIIALTLVLTLASPHLTSIH
ncbi:hypothetical protein C8F04DRAFT_1282573 [Mycena alexandri]|uniref:Uncharacterized protein n=1 Tax=Mycena alexandri TaxID=1745969 RepID=A0AAD6WKX6_9AGAR|nr:hypothetical protein C8F04DRAFT_1282573 [Mycena alexandri]